jgi:hypothetical protein
MVVAAEEVDLIISELVNGLVDNVVDIGIWRMMSEVRTVQIGTAFQKSEKARWNTKRMARMGCRDVGR